MTERRLSTKLFAAVDEGNLDAVKSLLSEDNADVNTCNKDGFTLLMHAAFKGEIEICKHLLDSGADVHKTQHENQFSALMMGSISGKDEIVTLLLQHGARIDQTNSIGKTAPQLAAFVGRHETANLMRNFLSVDKLEPYITRQGDNEPRLPESAAPDLQKLITLFNPHPVKIVLFIMDSPRLYSAEILKKAEAVMSDLLQKCVRSKQDFDEILALKLFYYETIVHLCYEHLTKQENATLDSLVKTLLTSDGDGFQVRVETIIRKAVLSFPYPDFPLVQHFIKTIHPIKIGSNPTSLSCLLSMFNGMHAVSRRHSVCEACAENASPLRCSACKNVYYCTKRCQKFHWFVHKKLCKKSG